MLKKSSTSDVRFARQCAHYKLEYYYGASQYYIRRWRLLLQTELRGLSVSQSICHNDQPCKNSRTNRDAVWVVDSVGPSNHVLDEVHINHAKG